MVAGMPKRCSGLILLLALLPDLRAEANTTTTNTTPPPFSRVRVTVQGQSGKFTVYDATKGESKGIQVTMDELKELDAAGNAVGTSGSTKHSINTFAAQSFTILPDTLFVFPGGVNATKVSFSSPVSTIGQISVDTYILQRGGMVGPPNEQWNASAGDLKWNIRLSNWIWCGDAGQCRQGEVGAFIDVTVTVKGLGSNSKTNNKTVNLGSGMQVFLSNQVQRDGAWTAMPAGYPLVTVQGSQTSFTFRFPRFATEAVYDPLIAGVQTDSGSGAVASAGLSAELSRALLGLTLLLSAAGLF